MTSSALFQAMRERRSVRRFKSDPVGHDVITKIIEAAITYGLVYMVVRRMAHSR